MSTLIPEVDDEEEARDLIPEETRPQRRTAGALGRGRNRPQRWRVSSDMQSRLDELADAAPPATPQTPKKPPKPLGLMGTIKEGAKTAARALGATVDTYQGDGEEVVGTAKEQAAAPKDPRLEKFMADIQARGKAYGDDPSLWESIKSVGGASLDNPGGLGLMIAEQLPNSAVALGAGAAGALAGSTLGPIGTIAGGLAGLFAANTGLETGHKALEAATDGTYGAEEQDRVIREGAIKGGAISAVDAATLGMTKFITGTTRRAMESATVKTLTDNGVDVANRAAMKAARENPELVAKVQAAQKLAQQGSEKLGKRLARGGGAVALETVGEGAGEYIGEYAATGKASTLDAVIESIAGLGTSAGEIAATSILNKKAMERLFGTKAEADKAALDESKRTGIEHEVKETPKGFVAVPKARSATGTPLETDAAGNLKPVEPESTQTDFNLANKEGFLHTAEDKIREREKAKAADAAYKENPVVTIGGKDVTTMSDGVLAYSRGHGSMRAQAAALAEIERRKKEGVDPAIANAEETPSDSFSRIITTGREKAQEEAKKTPVSTPAPAPVSAATVTKPAAPKAPEAAKEPAKTPAAPVTPAKPAKTDESTLEHDGDTWRIVSTGATREDGKIFAHLASTTRGNHTRNGVNPVQISDWIDPAKVAAVKAHGDKRVYLDVPFASKDQAKKHGAKWDADKKMWYATRNVEGAHSDGEIHLNLRGYVPDAENVSDNKAGQQAAAINLTAQTGRAHEAMQWTDPKTNLKSWIVADVSGDKPVPVNKNVNLGTAELPKTAQTAQTAQTPAATATPATPATPKPEQGQPVATVATVADNGVRPLVESLIKRRSAAKETKHGNHFDKVLAFAKALMAGEKVSPARFKSAADIFKGDKATADILNALHVKAQEAEKAAKQVDKSANQQADKSAGTPPAVAPEKPVITEPEATKPAPVPPTPPQATTNGKKPTRQEILQAHFAPGNIIKSDYSKEFDRVLSFDWNGGAWHVRVERVKKDASGNWQATERPRTHATYPDRKDTVEEHAKLKADIQDFIDGKTDTPPDVPPTVKDLAPKADPKKAQATRKKVERDLHVLAATDPELMDMAGTMDIDAYTEGVNEKFTKEITRIANEYGGPEKAAVLELVKDGKAVLPKQFYASAYTTAKLAWQEQQKMAARDPQLYKDTLSWGMGAREIDKDGLQAVEYKDGFDHALKGKTRSTLPQGGKHGIGYDDARAWIKTADGKAWFEGKRQSKEKSTGESLRRHWERVKKGLDSLTSANMDKAWAQILKATTRADLFPVLLADDATPGAKAWLDAFRGKIATFSDFYVREMLNTAMTRGRYGSTAERVFAGKYTSYEGRNTALDMTDVDVTEEMAAEREKAKQAVVEIYAKLNKLSPPAADALARQQEVINDESRWQGVASSLSMQDNHAQTSTIFHYFQNIGTKKKDKARLALTKQIAQEYQQHLTDLARKFDGLKNLAEIRQVIEATFGKSDSYKFGSKEAGDVNLYYDNRNDLKNMLPHEEGTYENKYGLWRMLEESENNERAEKERKDTLMRPRLDRIQRTMPDERKGRSITAAEFKKTFNFSDVTIGEYVTAKEAEDHLNYAYDALQSLALMLGAKPSQLSFGGKLHFSIGALGHGKYAAHFQPAHPTASGKTVPVINVTKTRGDGSVLHEYFHAIDFLTTDPALKRAIESMKKVLQGTPVPPENAVKTAKDFLRGHRFVKNAGRMTRKEQAIYALKHWYAARGNSAALRTQFFADAVALDEGSSGKPYWSNQYEPWARAAESWGYDRLKDSGQRDDYLQSSWAGDGVVTKKTHRGTPYPLGDERRRLNAHMEEFTKSIEWTDAGPVLKADHIWQKTPPYDLMSKPYADAVEAAIADMDKLIEEVRDEDAKKNAETQAAVERRREEKERAEREKLFGPQPTPPQEPEVPTSSSEPVGDAPMSDDELASIFDEVAQGERESTQDKPDAPEPGAALDKQAWTREDVFHVLNLVMQGRMVLFSGEKFATDNGLPTIQGMGGGNGNVRHMGYGVFQATTGDYSVNWTAGGAMDNTPGGKAYTTINVESGVYPYPKDKVINALHRVIGTTSPISGEKKAETPNSGQKKDKPLPDLKDEQDKTAAVLAAEFAKHGVKGIDKTLSGLVKLFGGGPNKLQSFPGGFDEKTYAEAKVLFKEAAEEFRKSGVSFKEFVRLFFKALITQFGDGVKPYAVKFAGEYQKTYEQVDADKKDAAEPEDVESVRSPSARLADWVYDRLEKDQATTWQELFAHGDKEFDGTQANGVYTPKDAYDAVELAINRYIIQKIPANPTMQGQLFAKVGIANLERILALTPTQTKRTAEMDEFQQFSTPPHFSFVANWVANLNNRDVYLEPSAGVGGLAVFAKVANVRQIIVNELSARRLALLRTLPFDNYFGENAEQLNNILPDVVQPTVIVMNPPFSATAGRMQGTRDTKNGAVHIEQALKRLAPGGRLVAIVGEGMAADKAAFKEWWTKIGKEYNVRVNVGVSGASYAKYGTTFDNQILVIDKDGPTTGEIITGKVDHPGDALKLLEGVRNDRPAAKTTDATADVADGTGRAPDAGSGGRGSDADATQNPGAAGPSSVGGGGNGGGAGKGGSGPARPDRNSNDQSDGSGTNADQSGRGGKDGDSSKSGERDDQAGNSKGDTRSGKSSRSDVRLDKAGDSETGVISNAVFEPYSPKKVRIEGAVPHNTPLVESAAMAAVSPPDPTYTPNLPKNVITKGLLSDAQLEAVVYAGQAHSQMLRDGKTRRGFFIGDGTGVGKGREISGIIMDSMRQGRKKAVWISKKKELIEDAKRDFGDIGGDAKQILPHAKHNTTEKILAKEGILFSAYPTLRSQSKAANEARKKAGKQRKADEDGISYERIRQIVDWVGKDFDGVIVFDEAHEMGNAVGSVGARGAKQTSDQAEAGLQLQKALPNARIVYVSATGATEVTNLGYAPRLGLWGDGTPFTDVNAFINAMSGSVSAMELVAQNLKQMGLYVARSLSFEGVTYEQLQHDLTPFQTETYDLLAKGWQIVLNNMEKALETTGTTGAGKESGKHKAYLMNQFWSTHQRFFNQIITASQMPSILAQIEQDLKDGKAVVLQVTDTGEAGQDRAIAKAAAQTETDGQPAEELDLSPREQLTSLIQRAFPVLQYQAVTESDGTKSLVPVTDSNGVQVMNKEAVAQRDKLIEDIKSMRIPDSPLQMLIDQFGVDNIAEITGRSQRLVKDEKGKYKAEKRGANAVAADSQAFKDGKKNILVFSAAGGTGFSWHSDKRYKNRKKRAHYIMQAGWSADKAVQGFGRTHRTNEENQPVYRLVKTNIPGHKRFISSIARRLEQLGALTAGQRDTAGGSIFSAADNLESKYATLAVHNFFRKLISLKAYPTMDADLLQQMGLTGLVNKDTGAIVESKLPPVTRFLNRILSLRLDTQNQVFNTFMFELEQQIEMARRLGTFDDGLATIKHVGAEVLQENEVYRDQSTNADVRYIEIKYQTKNEFHTFEEVSEAFAYQQKKGVSTAWFKNKQSGRVAAMWSTDMTNTLKTGEVVRLYGIYRTSGRSLEAINTANMQIITEAQAREMWEQENAVRPLTREHPLHMVVGGILPLWDRFNPEHVQVARIAVDDGRRFLGRQIAGKDLKDTLNKLDVESSTAKMKGPEIVKEVLAGKSVTLTNGWAFKKVLVSNDTRIELDLAGRYLTMQAARQITDSGGIYERIGWKERYFFPTDVNAGGKAINELMQKTGTNPVTVMAEDAQADDEQDGAPAAFSRSEEPAAAAMPKSEVKRIVDGLRAKWENPPEVVLLDSIADASAAVRAENERQLSKGAKGNPEGFVHNGKVYIVASEMKNASDVERVLLHEALGHFGLRGLFGDKLDAILRQVSALRRSDVEAKAKQYGLNMRLQKDRLIAAEEVLAGLAQTNPKNTFVQRAIAAIRTWLRENVPSLFRHMEMTDAEIINNYLIPAREFVQRGRNSESAPGGLAGAFSRDSGLHAVNARVNRQIEQWAKGRLEGEETLQLGHPSEILNLFDLPNLPIRLRQSVLTKARKKHGLNAADLKDIALNVQTPIAVFKSTHGEGHIVLVTEGRHAKGNVTVALELDIQPQSIAINDITTIYPRPDSEVHVWVERGALLGYEKRKGRDWLEDSGGYNPRRTQAKATPDNVIVYSTDELRNTSDDDTGTRFSRAATAPAANANVAIPANGAPFRDRMEKVVDSLIYNFQDRFKPLKDIQKRAGAVPEEQDATLAEERYSGTVRARTDDFEAEHRTPLIKAIHDSGVAYEDVEDYLHALHAPSRNAAMREINPTEAELTEQTEALTAKRETLARDVDVEEYVKARRELRLAEADIDDGLADESLGRMLKQEIAKLSKMASVRDYLDTVDKLRALRNVKPFLGDNTALSGMSNAEADAIIAKAKKQGTEKALAGISAMIDTITTKTREIFVEAGLEKAETIAAWNAKYEHYVPLHRDEVGGSSMPRIGQGFNIRGRESKRATGSNREVTHILAHVIAQHEAAIIRAEKTKVDLALFRFAQAHPDPDLWTLDTADMIRTVDPTSGLVVNRVDPTYKMRANVLTLKINGEEHTITFNERNEEGMRLVTSMKNLSAQQLGEVTQMVGKITRFMATMSTTANPVFIARNFLRDLQTAYINLTDTELAEKKAQVFRDVPGAIRGMWNMARGDKTSEWAKYAAEFKAAGGQTGWMEHYKDIGTRAESIRSELAGMEPGKVNVTKRTLRAWWDVIEDANNAVENGVRLASYVNARKGGMTEGKAAQLAKNLTVNFNAHGARGVELNAWYMFMNASIQGSARLVKALSNKQVRRIVGGVILSGFLMDVLARSMAGDDDEDGENDYDQLPEHVKAMNFVLWADERPVTIPMPYGYNAFASVGRKMSEIMFREEYSAVQSAVDLANVIVGAFSPTGQAGSMLQYIAPTVADPFIQWSENKNFAGNPLRRTQNPFGVPNPEYQMGFKSTSAPAKWLAEALNDESGGNEVRPGMINMNPAFFDFAVTSVLGGAGRTYLQAASLPMKALGDDEIQAREVPFANIFLSAQPEHQIERKYFDAVRKVELVKEELKTYRQKGDLEMVDQIRAEHASELSLLDIAAYTKAVLSNLRKRELLLQHADPENRAELRQAIEEKKRATMARFNKRYREAVSAEL